MALEWASQNRQELMDNWSNIESKRELKAIKPLDE